MFEWVVGMVEKGGYGGVALLMFLENVFPPIPSEVIMPLAGFAAARGSMNIWLVILSGAIGSLAGATFWYYIGKWFGNARVEWLVRHYGRILTMSMDDLEKAREWFRWRANLAVFIGRVLPGIRTLISVPAGILPMRLAPFLFWSSLGTAIWTTGLGFAGYMLQSQFALVEGWIDPASKLIIFACVAYYIYRFVTFKQSHPSN